MIDQTIDDPSLTTLPIGQTGELSVRIVQQVRENMERHADNVRRQVLIKIEMAGDDPEYAAEKRDSDGRHSELRKKLRELKTKLAIKIKIKNALRLANLVGGCEGRRWRELRSHQEPILSANSDILQRKRKAAAFIFESACSASSRMLSASSRSARV